ncbi:MAG TPA: cytochrome c [Candidatus Eisenbacteria bacterium]
MNRRIPLAIALLLATVLPLGGCGGGGAKDQTATTPAETSPLDIGPRAGDSPVAAALAVKGEALFKTKGCTACHAYGKRLTGPDLRGVTRRRTAQWMESQILHPEVMIKQDPIARALFAEYNLQMANQGLVPDEAKAVVEYFKKLDEEAEAKGELPASK